MHGLEDINAAVPTTSSKSPNWDNSTNNMRGLQLHVASLTTLGNFSDAVHTNLDLLTLGNVPPGSRTMWVHLVSVYVITLVALKVSSQVLVKLWSNCGQTVVKPVGQR